MKLPSFTTLRITSEQVSVGWSRFKFDDIEEWAIEEKEPEATGLSKFFRDQVWAIFLIAMTITHLLQAIGYEDALSLYFIVSCFCGMYAIVYYFFHDPFLNMIRRVLPAKAIDEINRRYRAETQHILFADLKNGQSREVFTSDPLTINKLKRRIQAAQAADGPFYEWYDISDGRMVEKNAK